MYANTINYEIKTFLLIKKNVNLMHVLCKQILFLKSNILINLIAENIFLIYNSHSF